MHSPLTNEEIIARADELAKRIENYHPDPAQLARLTQQAAQRLTPPSSPSVPSRRDAAASASVPSQVERHSARTAEPPDSSAR